MAPSVTSPPESLRGARHPRVEVKPDCDIAYSYGDVACELMSRAGQVMDPWQSDALDLMMSVKPDGQWACFEYAEIVARQNGKGAILEARALTGFLVLGERLIMWSAHEYKTAMEAFRRCRGLLLELGEEISPNLINVDGVMIKVNNTNGEESFERLDTRARIKFIARSKGSGRGFSGDVNIIDETFAYTPIMHDALMPTMNARPNPQIIYTSSPPLDSFSGEVLFGLRERAEAGGDDSLGYRDWGAEGVLDELDSVDLDDQELYAKTNPALGMRITLKTVIRNRRSMNDVGFAREILGIWPRQSKGGGAIDPKQWGDLADENSRRTGDVSIGIDIAPMRDYAAIAVYGLRDDELGHVQLLSYKGGVGWLIERIVELRDALDPIAIGMGRGTYESLKVDLEDVGITVPDDPEKPERGQIAFTNGIQMAAACGQIITAVRESTLRHLGEHPLDAAVAAAKTRQTGDTIAWHRLDNTTDISPLVSVTVARWAHITRVDLVTADYDVLNSIG